MIEIKKYTATQLCEFTQTPQFKELANQPVSQHRAFSYLHNPRLGKNDLIAYIACDKDEIVGYRTLLPDYIYIHEKPIKFAWFSGNWVKPQRRREGISLLIFNEVNKDWEGMLAYTNYAPESKAVYDKSEKFQKFYSTPGLRCYSGFNLFEILPPKSKVFAKIKPLLKVTDVALNTILIPWIKGNRFRVSNSTYHYQYINDLDAEISEFIVKKNQLSYNRRIAPELNWIEEYPWVVPINKGEEKPENYFFSAYASKTRSLRMKINDENGMLIAYMVIHRIDNRMTIPYFFMHENCDLQQIGQIIKFHQLKLKCPVLTVYNPDLVKSIKYSTGVYLMKKTMYRNYFAAFELYEKIKVLHLKFNDGDGDCAFT